MQENIERRCLELFGNCPFNIHEIAVGESYGWTEEDFLLEAARKHYVKENHRFFEALWEWKNGNKMQITREDAEKRNHYFNNARALVDEKVSTSADTPVNWMAFPNNDPTICYYIGVPLDCELCVWA